MRIDLPSTVSLSKRALINVRNIACGQRQRIRRMRTVATYLFLDDEHKADIIVKFDVVE